MTTELKTVKSNDIKSIVFTADLLAAVYYYINSQKMMLGHMIVCSDRFYIFFPKCEENL